MRCRLFVFSTVMSLMFVFRHRHSLASTRHYPPRDRQAREQPDEPQAATHRRYEGRNEGRRQAQPRRDPPGQCLDQAEGSRRAHRAGRHRGDRRARQDGQAAQGLGHPVSGRRSRRPGAGRTGRDRGDRALPAGQDGRGRDPGRDRRRHRRDGRRRSGRHGQADGLAQAASWPDRPTWARCRRWSSSAWPADRSRRATSAACGAALLSARVAS